MAATKKYKSTGPQLHCGKGAKSRYIDGESAPITAAEACWEPGHVDALFKNNHLRLAIADDAKGNKTPAAKGSGKGKSGIDLNCYSLDPKTLKGKDLDALQLIACTIAGDNKLDEVEGFEIPQFKNVEEGIKFLSQQAT